MHIVRSHKHLTRFSSECSRRKSNCFCDARKRIDCFPYFNTIIHSAVGDDFMVAAIITIVALGPILFIRAKKRQKSEHVIVAE